jgi:hypothetical protein
MGMRVGSGGSNAVYAQMRAAQTAQPPVQAAPAKTTAPASSSASSQMSQGQSILEALLGKGGKFDGLA